MLLYGVLTFELNGDDWPASSSDNFTPVTVGGEAGRGPGAGLDDVEH